MKTLQPRLAESRGVRRDRSKAWADRASRHQRGYGTAWDKLRLVVLKRDGYLCQCDQCKGGDLRTTEATEVDHIRRKEDGGSDDPSNLRAVSHACHLRISAEQMRAARCYAQPEGTS